MDNFSFLDNIPIESSDEIFETIVTNEKVKIQRIISYGQITKDYYWYDQDEDEFVMILEGDAKIKYDDGSIYSLSKGDSLYIKAHQKHQVVYTSNPAIWLAIFINKKRKKGE
jgi:cupin 2 domain-containing protein